MRLKILITRLGVMGDTHCAHTVNSLMHAQHHAQSIQRHEAVSGQTVLKMNE